MSRPVKQEVREHAIEKVAAGEPLFAGVSGYEDTVMPQLENALLAGHDVIFLGERGQAKTRMIRSLTGLLDEWMPIVAGSEINDDPYHPVSKHARDLVAELGDDTPITWVHRDDRYGEKLATPDTSIADLIGEVDPIKVAEGRYLSDELTLHYGLVPRTNRGIFAINELPDLAERIQVGMLNVLEERDVQIRGYKIRLPLDVMLLASANPEDYTNRGRIITPLKDRFGSQIRTHYPLDVADRGRDHAAGGAPLDVTPPTGDIKVVVPDYLTEVVATFSHLARASNQVNQRSGVSVRLSVSNYEALAANALRRGLRSGERIDRRPRRRPRRTRRQFDGQDRDRVTRRGTRRGDHGAPREGRRAHRVQGRGAARAHRAVVDAFEEGAVAHTGEGVTSEDLARLVEQSPRCARRLRRSPAATSHRRRSARRSSSSSRVCTSASGSTRIRAAPAPPTAAAPDPSGVGCTPGATVEIHERRPSAEVRTPRVRARRCRRDVVSLSAQLLPVSGRVPKLTHFMSRR